MKNGLSTFSAIITLVTGMLGVGINFMPSSFSGIGYLSAMYIMAFVSLLTAFSVFCACFAAYACKSGSDTYSALGYSYSKKLGYIVDLSILLALFFTSTAFHKYLVNLLVVFLVKVKEGEEGYEYWKAAGLILSGVPLYYLSLMKDLSSLWFTSYLSVFCASYLSVLVPFFSYKFGDKIQCDGFDNSGLNFGSRIGNFVLAMCCQVNVPKIYSELNNKTISTILTFSIVGSMIGGAIYSCVGFFGYRLLGNKIGKDDLMKIFCDSESDINKLLEGSLLRCTTYIAVIGAICVLIGAFPLQLNPATTTLMKLLNRNDDSSRTTFTTLLFVPMLIINFIPGINLDSLLTILGAIFSNALSFIYPCIYYICASKQFNALSAISYAIMCLSVVTGGYIIKCSFLQAPAS